MQQNVDVWNTMYAAGKADLRYPSDVLVRMGNRLLDRTRHRRILDYGFGTGANLVHFASLGFEMHGVEISPHAVEKARRRLDEARLGATLGLALPGAPLAYKDEFFDAIVVWQVLYYNDWSSLASTVEELERVLRPGGLVISAMAAPGDVSEQMAVPLGDSVYRSLVPDQEGCIVLIPEAGDLKRVYPGRHLEVGEFVFDWGGIRSRHWLVSYTKSDP